MRVMVLVKATEDSEKGFFPDDWTREMMAAMGRFNDALRDAGVLVMADGLTPSAQGKRVAFDGPRRTVIDGPFTPAGELVAGFWIWEVRDMDEAVAWVKRLPWAERRMTVSFTGEPAARRVSRVGLGVRARDSRASKIGWGLRTMPSPPPKGRSSTVR